MEQDRHSGQVGIYIHIPFCEKKCFYCDFYSVENRTQQNQFVNFVIKEISLFAANRNQTPSADTVFFGGGTPSLLAPQELEAILDCLKRNFKISDDAEVTMECNPGTVNQQSLAAYHQIGVNRLSFGVQSFFDDELKFLSRIHDSKQALEAFALARAAGFENVNIDLIYGLPDQSESRLLLNLEKAAALKPEHISAYNLIVEHGTPLYSAIDSGKIKPLDELTEAKMYELVMSSLEGKGYRHYEISNYARHGFECKHNLKYWNGEEYIGFGPSAHSYFNGTRWWNVSNLSSYISALSSGHSPISAKEKLSETQLIDEFIMLQLRQGKVDLKVLHDKFGINLDSEFISYLEKAGHVSLGRNEIVLTKKGFTVCDEIAEQTLRRF